VALPKLLALFFDWIIPNLRCERNVLYCPDCIDSWRLNACAVALLQLKELVAMEKQMCGTRKNGCFETNQKSICYTDVDE